MSLIPTRTRPWVSTAVVLSAMTLAAGVLAERALGTGTAVATCATANLRLDFVPPVQAATGHRFWNLTLRNVGSTTCHLKGFPGVGLLDADANLINDNVVRQTGFARPDIVLHPWQRAWFSFEYSIGAFCPGHSLSAYGIEVFPPNSTSRLVYYSGKIDVCGPPTSHPSVYPLRPSETPL